MAKSTNTRGLYSRMNHILKKDEHGFTLVEMLVSISILSVIMAGMFSFLWGASTHWSTAQSTAEATENARLGLNRMTRELKQSSNITSASADQVTFRANFGAGTETITYGHTPGSVGDTGTVWRSTSASPGELTLINDVESMQFTYYGNDYKCDIGIADGIVYWSELQACSTSPVTKIARVDISLILRAGNNSSQTFVEQAWLRNRSTTP
ncbi:MAG: prepilin-type N-terminal cleavage/methylation domain-containing protein [Thermoleophilia bacterium]